MIIVIKWILVLPFAGVEGFCRIFASLLMWDSRPMESEWIIDYLKKPS
jgi:hypothetical protein